MPFIDGLPAVSSFVRADLLPLCQNSTGTPGSGSDAKLTLAQLIASLTHNDISDWAAATSGFFGAPGAPGPISAGGLGGLTLAIDGSLPNTVLDIGAGSCADSTNTVTITLGARTKSIAGSWVTGTAQNGMGTGLTATASTWYHVFAIIVSGVADVYFDTSAVAVNKPGGTTAFRRIGAFKLDASVHIIPFNQYADRFDWNIPVLEFQGTPGVASAVTRNLLGVPPGVPVAALFNGQISDPSSPQNFLYLSALAQNDLLPNGGTALTALSGPTTSGFSAFSANVMTNTSAQIRYRVTSTTTAFILLTNGWIDTRGRG